LIRIAGPLDSIVAHSALATDFFNSIDHLPSTRSKAAGRKATEKVMHHVEVHRRE
jgi:hypothetical protein